MKYFLFICLCLGLYRFSSHSLRMKITPSTDCTTYKAQKTCVANLNCVWNTNCQPILLPSPTGPTGGVGGTWNTVSSTTNTTTTKYTSASLIK